MENIASTLLKSTEQAALAAYRTIGLGQENLSDQVAVNAMRCYLNQQKIDATVVIGEGERDNAPMLYIGEKVGQGVGLKLDIALDPLEGTSICAYGKKGGSMSVIAAAESGAFLNAPDIYMAKIAVGKNLPLGIVSLKNNIETNLHNLADEKKCTVAELLVVLLKRDRHLNLINEIKKCGARLKLIDDGDIAAVVSLLNNEHDLYVGIGGAPEGVLSASALHSLGGQFEGKLVVDTENLKLRVKEYGIEDIDKIYTVNDLVKSDSVFVATGITDGDLITGIKFDPEQHSINSIVITPGKMRKIQSIFYTEKVYIK